MRLPVHLLMVVCKSAQSHSKDGMRLQRTPYHECQQLKHLKAAQVKNHEKTKMTRYTTILTLCKLQRERKPGWLQNAKTLLIGARDLRPLTSTCRCSRTNEWNSTSAGSTSDPLSQPSSYRPSSSCPNRLKAD